MRLSPLDAVAIAVAILIPSGLEIFAAFPSFGDKIPQHDLFIPPPSVRSVDGWAARCSGI